MKIQFCSDLHLEFAANQKWLQKNPIPALAETLIIAGDTFYLGRDYSKLDVIKKMADDFKQVYLIQGNHEFYGGYDFDWAGRSFTEMIFDNVQMVNNQVIEKEGIQLIFSTMWSQINNNIREVTKFMADFRLIQKRTERINVHDYNKAHAACFEFLEEAVAKAGKKIVVTHHLPSASCNVKEFKNSPINEGFMVDKTAFISDSEIDYWIYGHSHRNKADFEINGTKMVTNQLGYTEFSEGYGFNASRVIEI